MSLKGKKLFSIAILAPIAFSLAACSGFTLSDDAKEQGKEAICTSAKSSVEQLKAGGSAAKFAATVIRDNTDNPQVKDLADKVAKDEATEEQRQKLADWLEDECL